VVRHQDVAEEIELMTLAKLFQFAFKEDTGGVVVEVREPMVTTEGDEVVAAFGLVSL